MGTVGFNKDPNVDLYFQLNKPFYYAGEWIQGIAYLILKNHALYNALYIRLEGHQYCHWSQGSRKHRRSYTGNRQTYEDEFLLTKSDNGFSQGHYSFPFSFQLPIDMSGSYTSGGNTNFYIHYPLQVRLVDFQGKNNPQIYAYNISVLQPPRMQIQPLKGQKTTNPQVCCCCNQGTTSLMVEFDKNIAMPGETVNLKINVDNSRCKKEISSVNMFLQRHLFMESNGGTHRNRTAPLNTTSTPSIAAGSRDEIQMAMTIPPILNPTAIGNIVANYFTIDVQSNVSGCICCGDNDPYVQGHIYIGTATPEVMRKPEMTAPEGWNPRVAPLVVYNSMKPFEYHQNINLRNINNRQQYP